MDEALGYLIGIIIAIWVIVKIIIPLVLAAVAVVLAVFCLVGFLIGMFVTLQHVKDGISETRQERQKLQGYANQAAFNASQGQPPSTLTYEDVARPGYFFGPCYADIGFFLSYVLKLNFSYSPNFGARGSEWYTELLFNIYEFVKMLVVFIFGTITTLALSLIVIVLFAAFLVILYPIIGIRLFLDRLHRLVFRVYFLCHRCHKTFPLPIYLCPECGMRHRNLRPGKYGIFRRRCLCGTRLPLTGGAKGRRLNGQKFKLKDMETCCPDPLCNASHNAGFARPLSVALLGGASSGKTTFKIAFLCDFLDDEMLNAGIDYDFPDNNLENEYNQYKASYKGLPIPPTARGADVDISTFNIYLRHKKMGVDRLLYIYDMAGEVFESGDPKEGWDLFSCSDGAVFLLDPYTLRNVKEENRNDIQNANMGFSQMHMNDLVQALIDTMERVDRKRKGGKFTVPVALAINKVDTPLLKQQIGEPAIRYLMTTYPQVFSERYATMDYVCRSFLASREGEAFIANLDTRFETVRFFSCSSMGFVPKGVAGRFHPIDVIPIMQWITLRADKQFRQIWKPREEIPELSPKQRELYRTHKEYYDDYVANNIHPAVTF